MTMGTEDHICSSAARMKVRKDMGHYSIPVGSIPVGNNYSDYKLVHSGRCVHVIGVSVSKCDIQRLRASDVLWYVFAQRLDVCPCVVVRWSVCGSMS